MGINRSRLIGILVLMASIIPAMGQADPVPKEAARVVRLGVITLYHPLVMYRKFQPFADYLSETTGYRFELKISQDYDNILGFLRRGAVDAALLGGLTYIKAHDATGVTPVVAALGKDGTPFCRGIFITRESRRDIRSIQDLKGKRMAFASKYSTSGALAPFYHLYENAQISVSEFSGYSHLGYHDSVAREVLRGNFDAGVVLDSVARRYQDSGIRFVESTDPFPGFLIASTPSAPPMMVESLKQVLLNLDPKDPETMARIGAWDDKIKNGFTRIADADYDPIRGMIRRLSGKGIMPGVVP